MAAACSRAVASLCVLRPTSTSGSPRPLSGVALRRQWGPSCATSALAAGKQRVRGKAGNISTRLSRGALEVKALRPGEREPLPLVKVEGKEPEAKAAESLKTFFTMVAVRVVLDQMQGTRHRQPIAKDLIQFLNENPIVDSNAWLAKLMKHDQPRMRMVAVRVIEVRKVYSEQEFDWAKAKKLAESSMKDDSLTFQRHLLEVNISFDEGSMDNA